MARGQTDDAPLYYWFDSEHETLYSDSTGSGHWKQMVDVSQLKVGFHTFYVITTDSKGRVSTPEMRQFYKIDQSADGEQFRCLCYVDGEMFCQKEVSANSGLIDMELDATGLSEGMHRIQLQVLTASGVVSGIHNGFFLRTATTQELGRLRCMCYVDGMLFSEESMLAEGGALSMNLDASGLTEGLHSIQMQVITETGVVSGVYNGFFIRKSMEQEIGQFRCLCYVDGELFSQEKMSAEGGLLALDLDTNSLTEGLHRIQLQVMTKSGIISGAYNGFFLRTATSEEIGQFLCMCYVDGELFSQETLSAEGGLLHLDLNASSLSEGMHRIQLQVMTENGTVSGTYNGFFLRIPTQEEQSNYSCIYVVDDETESHKFELAGNDGTYHFDLDMSGLSDGLHHISYFLSSDKGVGSSPQTHFFIKSPTGGNAIARYQYWLNDDTEHMKTVVLPEPQNPFKLISLLPIEKVPVRSSLFHFEIKNGEPMMYAKNDFHVRFYDAGSRFTDETRQYVDYNVSRVVENVADLQKTQTADRPADNELLWYKFESMKGDSVSFRLSQAATLQVFSPEGEEVYKAQGSKSVTMGGCHTWQDGVYYVALHDVMGSKPDVTLTFSHYSKYDVVRQDVDVVGNGGCSTITFDGNGFKDLYAVDLYTEKGDTIHSAAICYTSDAKVSITFNFSNVRTGKYHSIFHFAEGEKKIENILTVEEAKWIDLTLDVNHQSTFLQGTSTTFTITVTNKGNATAYNVPMEIYLQSGNSFNNIQYVVIKDENGIDLSNRQIDIADSDSIDNEALSYINDQIRHLNGKSSFLVITDTIYGEYGCTNQLLTVPPLGKVQFCVEVKSQSAVMLKARIPDDWMTVHTTPNAARIVRRANPLMRNWCCEKEAWECKVNIWANVIGMIPVAGCASGLADLGAYTTFEIACADGYSLGTKELDFYNSLAIDANKRTSLIDRGINGFIGCVSGVIGKAITKLAKKLNETKKLHAAALKANLEFLEEQSKSQRNAEWLKKAGDAAADAGDYTKAKDYWEASDKAFKEAEKFGKSATDYYYKSNLYKNEIIQFENDIDDLTKQCQDVFDAIKNGVSAVNENSECTKKWNLAMSTCPPNPKGGTSRPVISYDPNDIYGYLAESGSNAVKDGLTDVYYRIEFENDTAFATAAAHQIVITDTLDAKNFDLSSYQPTRVKIGEKTAELSGDKNFVTTVDMRPEINAIAQVTGTYDEQKGIAQWRIESLDPMTMEPTDDPMEGVLPVNYDGSGIGEVSFNISLKPELSHGSEVDNRAGIVFDNNDVIMTPTWTNIIDRIAPESHVNDVLMLNDSTASVSIQADDELSGVWRYDVYVQYGAGSAWWKAAENIPADTTATVKIYEGIDHGFYVVATDSAGNVERKQAVREQTLNLSSTIRGDVNRDGQVGIADIVAVTGYMAGTNTNISLASADVNGDGQVGIADIVAITDIMAGTANIRSRQNVRYKTYFVKRKEYVQQ